LSFSKLLRHDSGFSKKGKVKIPRGSKALLKPLAFQEGRWRRGTETGLDDREQGSYSLGTIVLLQTYPELVLCVENLHDARKVFRTQLVNDKL
jgi:hypothetical protein